MNSGVLSKFESVISEMEELMCDINFEFNNKDKKNEMLKAWGNELLLKKSTILDENKKLKAEVGLLNKKLLNYEKEISNLNSFVVALDKRNSTLLREIEEFKEDRKKIKNENLYEGLDNKKLNNILEKNQKNPKKIIEQFKNFIREEDDEQKCFLVAEYIKNIEFLELDNNTFKNLLTLIYNDKVLIHMDEECLLSLIKILMKSEKEYELFLGKLVKKVLSSSIKILKNTENIEFFILLNTYLNIDFKFICKDYIAVLKKMQLDEEMQILLNFIENKKFKYFVFDFSLLQSKFKELDNLKVFENFLERNYQVKKDTSSIKKVKKDTLTKPENKNAFNINLDKVDMLSISNNIKTCRNDKNQLIRKRVELAIYNKFSNDKVKRVEASVYHCKKCHDYVVDKEFIRAIYKSIDTKKNYVKFNNSDNLNQVSIINILGYNTNLDLEIRMNVIDNIIIPTVGAKKLLNHLEFLVRFHKNNKKDFSNAIAIWVNDISYLRKNYLI